MLLDELRQVCEIAVLARGLGHAPQGAADQGHLAVIGHGGAGDGLQPRHVAGEAADRHPALAFADQLGHRGQDVGLGARGAFDEHIGGIADHGEDIAVAQAPQGLLVGGLADDRIRVELPVTVCSTVPSLVRNTTALGSGIEWVSVISSSSKGPILNLPDIGISVIFALPSSPASFSLRRSTEAVKGVAYMGQRSFGQR